jgi:two-component system, sensor histidine kinase PdtaS
MKDTKEKYNWLKRIIGSLLFIWIFHFHSMAAQPITKKITDAEFAKLKTTEERIAAIKVYPIHKFLIPEVFLAILKKEEDKKAEFYWHYAKLDILSLYPNSEKEGFKTIEKMIEISKDPRLAAEASIANLKNSIMRISNNMISFQQNYSDFLEIFEAMKSQSIENFKNYDIEVQMFELGRVFYEVGDYEKALEALQIGSQYKVVGIESLYYTLSLNLIETIYANQKDYKKAIYYAEQIYELNRGFNPNLDPKNWHSLFWQGLALINSAKYHLKIGQLVKAESLANQGLRIIKMNENLDASDKLWARFEALQALLNIKLSLDKVKESEAYVLESQQLFQTLRSRLEGDQFKFILYHENLANFYELKGDSEKTLYHIKKAKELQNELNNRNDKRDIWKIEMRVKAEKYKLDLKKIESERNQQRNLTIFMILLLVIGVISAFLVFRRFNKDNHIITYQKNILEKSLLEKETLLREIHHRVKNNLQIINGLLEKQGYKTDNLAFKELIKESQNRIYSMVLIHQNLYQTENIDEVDIASYLKMMVDNIKNTHQYEDEDIILKSDVDSIMLNIDTAIPLGLIINELLSNAYKYAFKNREKGQIDLVLKKQENGLFLSVKDDGIGLPEGFDLEKSKTLGMTLVKGLVRQIGGKLTHNASRNGSTFEVLL